MSIDELTQLCSDIRTFLIESISKTGGHLSSNLGIVEVTVAMHYVFDSPKDKMIFEKDVYTAYSKKLVDYIKSNNIDVIYLCGIDTECCVLKTAFDLFENGYDVKVLRDYSASTHGMESNNYILDVIGRSIGRDNVI